MTVGAISLGCNKNRVDTELMLGALVGAGHELVSDPSSAEVLIVNTCGFIGSAKEEAIDTILEMAEYKKAGSCKRLIVTGCLAQRYPEELYEGFPEVDAFLGVSDFDALLTVLSGERTLMVGDPCRDVTLTERVLTTPPYMAYLKIAEGCDNGCTYCSIPSIRGKYRSRPMDKLVAEAQALAARGVKEITLVAQDTTRYGLDLYGEPRLAELVERVCQIEGIVWVRALYCYPELVNGTLLDRLAAQEKFCRYIDMPIQHCDDAVLRAMRRRGGFEEIRLALEALRSRGFVARSTVIAGFPGETEEQFERLLTFLREAKFDRLGAFAYSEEEGTPAARMQGQVPLEVRQRRSECIMLQQRELSRAANQARVGQIERVLVTGVSGGSFVGRSAKEAPEIDGEVRFTASGALKPGSFVNVRMTRADDYDMEGERVP